jgi:hypothetical protein
MLQYWIKRYSQCKAKANKEVYFQYYVKLNFIFAPFSYLHSINIGLPECNIQFYLHLYIIYFVWLCFCCNWKSNSKTLELKERIFILEKCGRQKQRGKTLWSTTSTMNHLKFTENVWHYWPSPILGNINLPTAIVLYVLATAQAI